MLPLAARGLDRCASTWQGRPSYYFWVQAAHSYECQVVPTATVGQALPFLSDGSVPGLGDACSPLGSPAAVLVLHAELPGSWCFAASPEVRWFCPPALFSEIVLAFLSTFRFHSNFRSSSSVFTENPLWF